MRPAPAPPAGRTKLPELPLGPLVSSGIVGLVLWDVDGAIRDANERFLELIGCTRGELEAGALDWRTLTPQRWREADEGMIAELRAGRGAGPVEKEYLRADGARVPVRLFSAPIDAQPGVAVSIVISLEAQKRAQAEREAVLARERAAREEAEEAVQAREDILAIVSHDLRSPLQTVRMSSALLARLAGEAGAAPAAAAARAIEGMDRLIRDLLDVNHMVSGRFAVEAQPLALATLLDDARALMGPVCAAKRQALEIAPPGEALHVRADRNRIVQVFSNLVGNAAKFTPEGGRIAVSARRDGGEALVEVADDGPGIAPEDLPSIFERFWQARRVRRGGGVGLGLAISQGIVKAHGGRIWAESTTGAGSRFRFTLPLA